MPELELVNIKIDGKELRVPKGEKIIESAKRIGVEVPFFCYHPRLSMEDGGANCRMCLVEVAAKGPDGTVRKMPKPQTACSLPASEGMEITSESESLISDRRGILEFLLINHPLDCPICDRGGECPLQNNAIHYGPPTSRFIEEKRHFPKAYPLSTHVVFDRERCIHCARCTRFTTDISGDAQLNFLFRSADMEVSTFQHTEYESRFSGNVIELCPVGALLSRSYRFKARPWDLLTQRSICTQCSNGCNIKLDYRLAELQRVNARVNEAVNEEWTCDKGKFGMDYVSTDRITQPLIKRNGEFAPSTWEEANDLILAQLNSAGQSVGGIGGARATNEDLFAWQKFFREKLGVNNLDHRMGPTFPATNGGLFKRFGYHTMSDSITDLENKKAILVIGADLVEEQPIIYLRVRKAWRWNGASIVEANSTSTSNSPSNSVGEFASVSLAYQPGTEVALIQDLITAIRFKDSERPTSSSRPSSSHGVEAGAIRRAATLLAADDMAILVGKAIANHPNAEDVLAALGDLAEATGGTLNVPVTEVNQQGAMDMGILPDSLPGYLSIEKPGMNSQQMLEAASRGGLQLLWIMNADLLNEFHDRALAERALRNCPFIVIHAWSMNETAQRADVIVPIQSVAERDGTYTNCERRVQRFWKAFEVSPHIQPDWVVFAQLAAQMGGGGAPYFSVKDVLRDIAANVPQYKDITFKSLGDQGIRWEYEPPGNPSSG